MDWQSIVAILVVLTAALWLVNRAWRIIQRNANGGRVGACGHCPKSTESAKRTPLVQLSAKSDNHADEPPVDRDH